MKANYTYSDCFLDLLKDLGYSHCFFVAGGNIMHLLNSARTRFVCIPFQHEVSAGIAAEYFTALKKSGAQKAFVLVTAGPGLTNLATVITAAWLESRELLIVCGQVKTDDLKSNGLRQRGIQEIDGKAIFKSVTKGSLLIDKQLSLKKIADLISLGMKPRKGPVLIEFCLDIQGKQLPNPCQVQVKRSQFSRLKKKNFKLKKVQNFLENSSRPILLIGGGVSHEFMIESQVLLEQIGIPSMTTWNGADRVSSDRGNYFGRPNTWGQRSANILIQQSDLVIAVGTSLNLQQTGFNWQKFAPKAKIIHVDIDKRQARNYHPKKDLIIIADADSFLDHFINLLNSKNLDFKIDKWIDFCKMVRNNIPLIDPSNVTSPGFVKPHELVLAQRNLLQRTGLFIPSSSGGAETVSMQIFEPLGNQRIINNKSLASMGYGLAGAIGAALSYPESTVILNEGDGGFSQNLQELATVKRNLLNIKIFIWNNGGYASIRMTQRNYFDGSWVGCDYDSGLAFPDWNRLARAYGLEYRLLNSNSQVMARVKEAIDFKGPMLIEVKIDPEQTYFPKITSKIDTNGKIESNPLHLMTPSLDTETSKMVFRYI